MIKRTLYFGNPAYLRFQNQQLVIENKDGNSCIPIEDIGIVILDHPQITISQTTLTRLLENNAALINCDDTHHPIGLMLPLDSNTLQSERFQHQVIATVPLKKQLWQQTIITKVENQAAVLQKSFANYEPMLYWSRKVKSGDTDNIEARAAAHYWKELMGDDFIRDRYGDYPNNLLNYGYAF
jgi:CRISP-associated protein Cas1